MASRATQYRPVPPACLDGRAAPRHRVVVTRATVRRHGEEAGEAVLGDLSIYGCRLTGTDDDLVPGERLWLRFTGSIPIAATVVWCADGALGCRFDEPVPNRMVRALTLAGC